MTGPGSSSTPQCAACGAPVTTGRFEDRSSGVVYHTMCFATAMTGVGPRPARPHPAEILEWIVETERGSVVAR